MTLQDLLAFDRHRVHLVAVTDLEHPLESKLELAFWHDQRRCVGASIVFCNTQVSTLCLGNVEAIMLLGRLFVESCIDGCVCLAALDVAEELRGYTLWANNMVTERSNDFSAAVMEANPMPIQKQPC